jgi:hypothetical protein
MPNTFFSPFGGTANTSGGSSSGPGPQTFSNIGAAHTASREQRSERRKDCRRRLVRGGWGGCPGGLFA